ncbi:hypothetical protein CHELA1G11_11376 [Hyphomicrobiales bacterium]|nr:hypothetical protein CHELA1G11_11376 [Hyphomicrobiales bacterium]CAH1668183.1 hypothetical protein CHELA1G2_12931 [Hyphomicrobiales bacterium]
MYSNHILSDTRKRKLGLSAHAFVPPGKGCPGSVGPARISVPLARRDIEPRARARRIADGEARVPGAHEAHLLVLRLERIRLGGATVVLADDFIRPATVFRLAVFSASPLLHHAVGEAIGIRLETEFGALLAVPLLERLRVGRRRDAADEHERSEHQAGQHNWTHRAPSAKTPSRADGAARSTHPLRNPISASKPLSGMPLPDIQPDFADTRCPCTPVVRALRLLLPVRCLLRLDQASQPQLPFIMQCTGLLHLFELVVHPQAADFTLQTEQLSIMRSLVGNAIFSILTLHHAIGERIRLGAEAEFVALRSMARLDFFLAFRNAGTTRNHQCTRDQTC